MARTGKVPSTETTTTSGAGEDSVVTITMPIPQAVTSAGEPGGPGAPGYVFRDDEGFLAKVKADPGNLDQILADHLFTFRSVTDGVNWQQVGEEETRLRNLLEQK